MTAELHLKPRQLQAIGLFAAQWAYFEAEVDFTIAALGQLVIRNPHMPRQFNRRAQHWRKLAREFYKTKPDVLEKAEAIIDDAIDMHRGRNLILHGRVYSRPNPRSRRIFIEGHRHLKEWAIQFREMDSQLIFEGAELLKDLNQRLIDFNTTHLPVSPPALPKRYL